MKQNIINRGKSTNNNLKLLERKWNQRLTKDKTSRYDSCKNANTNIINLDIIKNKLKKKKIN